MLKMPVIELEGKIMATINDTLYEIEKQKNTLSILLQMREKTNTEQMRLVMDSCLNYDTDRLDAIKEFLDIEILEVQATIECLFGQNVSGTC